MAGWAAGWRYHALCFVSAFLLFQVELVIARALLPGFGSSAAVWTTSLVFFQGTLLLGYLLGERLMPRLASGRWRYQHLALALLPALAFPFRLGRPELPEVPALLLALAASVGLPFLALSTTTIVAQSWYARGDGRQADPYPLYGTSNLGSLLALLSYPLLVEPALGLRAQLGAWYALYGLYALLVALCVPARLAGSEQARPAPAPAQARAVWLLFSAAANALLMAVTNAITLDASVPLLWVVPLTLFLLTLVLCFGRQVPSWNTALAWMGGALAVAALGAEEVVRGEHVQVGYLAVHNAVVFIGCLLCHWNLARARPADTARLGSYYLLLSLGAFAGSLLIGLLAPLAFRRYGTPELDYGVIGVLLVAAFAARDWRQGQSRPAGVAALLAGAVVFVAGLVAARAYAQADLDTSRTFYGFYSVRQDGDLRVFKHGNTVHGLQSRARPDEPLAYYHRLAPVGRLLETPGLARASVGLVGLGVGTLAAYGHPGERWQFFEIDREVERVARTWFTFLERSRARVGVTIGDARLELGRLPEASYDLLVLDAFSSDSVPPHLLTAEALALYLRVLKPGGILLFHISSRLLDLGPELAAHARVAGLPAYASELDDSPEPDRLFPCAWFAMPRTPEGARLLERAGFATYAPAQPLPPPWTDDRFNLLQALRR